jgi:hypothetical protein
VSATKPTLLEWRKRALIAEDLLRQENSAELVEALRMLRVREEPDCWCPAAHLHGREIREGEHTEGCLNARAAIAKADDGQQEAEEVPADELCPDCWREKCRCQPEPSYSEVCRGIR